MNIRRPLLAAVTLIVLLSVVLVLLEAPATVRGHLVGSREAWTLTPCDSDGALRVVNPAARHARETVRRFIPPEEPLYVEVRGLRLPGSRLAIYDIRYAARETHGCRENLHEVILWALGNEPFWAVTVGRSEIRFEAPDEPGRVVFPAAEPVRIGDRQVYRVRNAGGDRLELSVREAACSDGMSDAHYPLTARVEIDGRAYAGCAREGWATP